ncbi:hypothetical protein HZS_3142 [Henneguya salminicola]|nr:hypothetical protein HZS_3142 [Henneguya salminicola]
MIVDNCSAHNVLPILENITQFNHCIRSLFGCQKLLIEPHWYKEYYLKSKAISKKKKVDEKESLFMIVDA